VSTHASERQGSSWVSRLLVGVHQHVEAAQNSGAQPLSSVQSGPLVGVKAPHPCPPARGGSSELRRSTTQLSAVRAPCGCQGSSSVSASGRAEGWPMVAWRGHTVRAAAWQSRQGHASLHSRGCPVSGQGRLASTWRHCTAPARMRVQRSCQDPPRKGLGLGSG